MGETSGGDPIFEVRSVRLVLRPDASHFNRVAACSKCGREVPGAAVLSPADLDLVPHPVICKSCVSTAGSPMFATERRRPLAPAPSPPEQSADNGSAPGPPAATPADDDRVKALERKLDEALEQLRISGEAHRSELLATVQDRMTQLRAGLEPQAAGREDWDEMSRRVDHIAERLMQEPAGPARFQDLEERMQRLQTMVEEGLVQPDAAALGQAKAELALQEHGGVQDELRRGLDAVDERLRQVQTRLDAGLARVQSDGATLAHVRDDVTRLEARLTGRLAGLADGVVTQRQELLVMIEKGLDGVARLSDQLNERLDRLSERTVRTEPVDNERLHRVEQHVDEAVRRLAEVTESQKADLHDGLAQVRSEIGEVAAADAERLQALEEWTVLAADADTQRVRAIEQHLEEASERLAQALESQRAELQSELRDGLAEVRSAVPEPVPVDPERLQALEERVAQTADQLSEIDELLAVLDSGFGELRSGIDALRDAETQRIAATADVSRALPAVDAQPVVRVEPQPGRRHGKRSETTAYVAAVAEATEQLALRQRQLESQMAALEQISDATVKSVARASSEAAALAPVRSELKSVRDELWEHDEALARLARNVDNLRRKISAPAPAPPAKKAPAAAKKAPAAKPATPAKPAARTPKKS